MIVSDAKSVKVGVDEFRTSDTLSQALNQPLDDKNVQLRLYVVEDLSRDFIELLGNKYDIDPAFRSHIVDTMSGIHREICLVLLRITGSRIGQAFGS
jgi:hypothetical protein